MKKIIALLFALIFVISPIGEITAIKSEATDKKTLADYPVGTVFKIREDGTLYDWILVTLNYEGIGNQLLMRKDTIYYASPIPFSALFSYHQSSHCGNPLF